MCRPQTRPKTAVRNHVLSDDTKVSPCWTSGHHHSAKKAFCVSLEIVAFTTISARMWTRQIEGRQGRRDCSRDCPDVTTPTTSTPQGSCPVAFCCVQFLPSVTVCKATDRDFPQFTVRYYSAMPSHVPAQSQSVKRYKALGPPVSGLDQKAGIGRKLWGATWSLQGSPSATLVIILSTSLVQRYKFVHIGGFRAKVALFICGLSS